MTGTPTGASRSTGKGEPLDGDQILTVLATGLKEAGRLTGDAVVVTVMSNQGFHVAMREAGIEVIETPVGDKHVSAAMRDGGYVLGGEQSGHIIMGEHATTGDGLLTSLQLLAAVNRQGVPLAAAAKMMPKYPQVLVNVPGDASQLGPEVDAAVRRAEAQLGGDGRILVRPSGTEPKIRLMIQARDAALAERVIGQLAEEVRRALADRRSRNPHARRIPGRHRARGRTRADGARPGRGADAAGRGRTRLGLRRPAAAGAGLRVRRPGGRARGQRGQRRRRPLRGRPAGPPGRGRHRDHGRAEGAPGRPGRAARGRRPGDRRHRGTPAGAGRSLAPT